MICLEGIGPPPPKKDALDFPCARASRLVHDRCAAKTFTEGRRGPARPPGTLEGSSADDDPWLGRGLGSLGHRFWTTGFGPQDRRLQDGRLRWTPPTYAEEDGQPRKIPALGSRGGHTARCSSSPSSTARCSSSSGFGLQDLDSDWHGKVFLEPLLHLHVFLGLFFELD